MDTVIEKARELGALLQQDERYVKFNELKDKLEKDTAVTELMGKIQLTEMAFQHEASKEDKDQAKLQELDTEYSQLVAQLMANPDMTAYEQAAGEIDKLMKYITGIFQLCLQGQDPATCEPPEEGCSGDCGSCGGCH